jgi:hypothetical protein
MAVVFTKPKKTAAQLKALLTECKGVPNEYQFSYTADEISKDYEKTVWVTACDIKEASAKAKEIVKGICHPVKNLRVTLKDVSKKIYRSNRPVMKG